MNTIKNTLIITVLSVAVLSMFLVNSSVILTVDNSTENVTSLGTVCNSVENSAENHVCYAQRGRVDPRVLVPLTQNYSRNPSDWNCFLLIFGVIAVFVGLAMSNKNGQQ